MTRISPAVVAGIVLVAAAPGAAQAAQKPAPTTKPSVATGLAGSITPQSATLTARIDPGGAETKYRFEYGTSSKYGKKTDRLSAGAGVSPVAGTAGVQGLQSAKTYHFRVVASNRKGTVRGKDRTFKTPKQPLGFSVGANPTDVTFGGSTVIAGTLGGTGSAGREVRLEQKPWPYQAAFAPVGNIQVTSNTGGFAFALLGLGINTQYRVSTTDKTPTISDVVGTRIGVIATTRVKSSVRRGGTLQFSGRVRPARVGDAIGVQRLTNGAWVTVKGSRTTAGAADFSKYAVRVRIRRSGTYRVFVQVADGSLQSAPGASVNITARRR